MLGLLAGGKLPEDDDDSIGTFLDLAGRLPPEAQARICRALSGVTGLVQSDLDALTVCTAEAADRTGDHEAAARAIEPAVRLDDKANPVSGSTALKAGILSELTGHLDIARARYEAAASYDETSIAGLVRLGDLDLREGDATGALDHYALAKAAVRTQVGGRGWRRHGRRAGAAARAVRRQQSGHRAAHDRANGRRCAAGLRRVRIGLCARLATRSRPRWRPTR